MFKISLSKVARCVSALRRSHAILLGGFCLLGLPLAAGAADLPDLPEGLASFGAAVAGDHVYVFGGHVGKTHQHSVDNLSHRFLRLDMKAPSDGWQEVGEVAGLQGTALVSDGQWVCRVGGMDARNAKEAEEEDLHSVDTASCFDVKTETWTSMPPLPQGRSSHDAFLVDGKIYVLGGWQLRGVGQDSVWRDHMAVLDLTADEPQWSAVPQPFRRRALAVAAAGGKIFAFGGLGEKSTSRRVDVFDIASQTWSVGPDLPQSQVKGLKGFGVSAFGVGDTVYLSAADGIVHSLRADAGGWSMGLGKLETPRFFHRLLHHDGELLFIGGAARSGHLADTETLSVDSLEPGNVPMDFVVAEAREVKADGAGSSWPGFRGHGQGHGDMPDVPLTWSEDENLTWSQSLPGYGQSAPVVWQDQVFVTSIDGAEKETLILSALALADGEVLWRRRFDASQKTENSEMVSRGAPTPVVDAWRIYAFWESGDLMAFNHHGETLWKRSLTDDFGGFAGNHGVASSPVLADGAVVVQVTHAGPSYFIALDQANGNTLWKVERPAKVAWTTPTVIEQDGKTQILSSAAGRVEALDAATGEQLWVMEGIEKNHVPSLVVDGDLAVVASSEAGNNMALGLDGEGTLNPDDAVLWRAESVASGFGSPLVHGTCVYVVNKAGGLHCLDRGDGTVRWKHRLAEALWASPVAVGEHVFFFGKDGNTTVLTADGDGPQVVAENALPTDDTVYGVAVAAGSFLIRTGENLVRVGGPAAGVEETQSGSVVAEASSEKAAD